MERIGNKSALGGISVTLPVNHAALQPPPPGRLHSTHQPPPLQPPAASRPPPRSVAAGSSCFAGRRLTGALASRSPTSTTHSCSATRAHRTVRARRTAARRASSRLAAGSRLPRGTSSWSAVCGRAPVVPSSSGPLGRGSSSCSRRCSNRPPPRWVIAASSHISLQLFLTCLFDFHDSWFTFLGFC